MKKRKILSLFLSLTAATTFYCDPARAVGGGGAAEHAVTQVCGFLGAFAAAVVALLLKKQKATNGREPVLEGASVDSEQRGWQVCQDLARGCYRTKTQEDALKDAVAAMVTWYAWQQGFDKNIVKNVTTADADAKIKGNVLSGATDYLGQLEYAPTWTALLEDTGEITTFVRGPRVLPYYLHGEPTPAQVGRILSSFRDAPELLALLRLSLAPAGRGGIDYPDGSSQPIRDDYEFLV
ncbi:MAG: hypothetical protein LBJ38_01350 [Oscillospiraceae bacterium]|jgi:hypothetical protein|nr:hypothetical protein [Oscillospiraceae bacterium]